MDNMRSFISIRKSFNSDNAGDSRCLMVGDKTVQLSINQKPDLKKR